jgi:hypothetical protein
MNNFLGFGKARSSKWNVLRFRRTFLLFLVLCLLAAGRSALGQSTESATAGGVALWAGAGASGYYIQYGAIKELGISGYVDADSIRHFGIEGEGRALEFRQTANVHVETYMGGPRYHFNFGRFQPYAKGLAGIGYFNFPYNYAHGSYLVVAPGGGIDYRLNRRWSARVDFEYQYWPQFTYGAMSSGGVTTGVRYRIF